MAGFLSNIRFVAWGSAILGALFMAVYGLVATGHDVMSTTFWSAVFRWLHVMSGIMWIGLLYYFNFVQIPNMPKIPDEQKPALGKVIAPAALFWFRWGAAATLGTGLALALINGYLVQTLTVGATEGFAVAKHVFLGVGMWLAIIMFLNVWVVIWPAQQKALNINNAHPDLPAEQKAAHGKTAMLFSRTNTFLSLPMLAAMTGAQTLG